MILTFSRDKHRVNAGITAMKQRRAGCTGSRYRIALFARYSRSLTVARGGLLAYTHAMTITGREAERSVKSRTHHRGNHFQLSQSLTTPFRLYRLRRNRDVRRL